MNTNVVNQLCKAVIRIGILVLRVQLCSVDPVAGYTAVDIIPEADGSFFQERYSSELVSILSRLMIPVSSEARKL